MSDQGDLFDIEEGRRRRDEGIERVLEGEEGFSARMRWYVRTHLRSGDIVMSEDIRVGCEELGIHPRHHNAWGGVTRGLASAGLLRPYDGGDEQSKRPQAHARRARRWVVV